MNVMAFEYNVWEIQSQRFWNKSILIYWNDESWLKKITLDRERFCYICDKIKQISKKFDSNLRKIIPILFIFTLRYVDYRTITKLFGIGHSYVCIIISNVGIKSTVDILLPKIVLAEICGFENISGYLQEFGVINGCHLRTKAPLKDADDYISWKDYHAIVSERVLLIIVIYFMAYFLRSLEDHMTQPFRYKRFSLYEDCLRITHKEKHAQIKLQCLWKNVNMNIWGVSTSNQLLFPFTTGSNTETQFSKT